MQIKTGELKTFTAISSKHLKLIYANGKSEIKNIQEFNSQSIKELFLDWKISNKEAAKKNAFDYINNDRTLLLVLFFLNLFILGGISLIFLVDGINTIHCNRLLTSDSSRLLDADILKIHKNRKANIIWTLKGTTETGIIIEGKRTAVNPEAAIHSPGHLTSQATIIYSTQDISCWDLSLEFGKNKLPIAQREFLERYTIGFGSFFVVLWAIIGIHLGKKIFIRKPFLTEITEIYPFI